MVPYSHKKCEDVRAMAYGKWLIAEVADYCIIYMHLVTPCYPFSNPMPPWDLCLACLQSQQEIEKIHITKQQLISQNVQGSLKLAEPLSW